MKKRFLFVLALISSAGSPLSGQDADAPENLPTRALELVNEARAEAGLSRLELDEILVAAAQSHARAMLERDFYAHVTPGGETPRDRFIEAGGDRWAVSGENIARCSGCAAPVDMDRVAAFQEGWMQSPEHRRNILRKGFDSFGFGIVGANGEVYAVQTFSGPGSSSANGTAAAEMSLGAAQELALAQVNDARASQGLSPLTPSDDLHQAATRALERRIDGEDLSQDPFALLPDKASGWTSLGLQSLTRGGSGTRLTEGNVRSIFELWRESQDDGTFGGSAASHFGFAARVEDKGRMMAIAVFGGRG